MEELRPQILSGELNLTDEISLDAQSLLKGMLATDPRRRMTITDILDHSWMAKIEK